jgi:hypothetical protein
MDAAQPKEFNAAALAQVAPALQGIIDQGALSGAVTLVWRWVIATSKAVNP